MASVSPTSGECSFIYRYILRESCSQFDSLPLTSLTILPTSARPSRTARLRVSRWIRRDRSRRSSTRRRRRALSPGTPRRTTAWRARSSRCDLRSSSARARRTSLRCSAARATNSLASSWGRWSKGRASRRGAAPTLGCARAAASLRMPRTCRRSLQCSACVCAALSASSPCPALRRASEKAPRALIRR